VANSSKPTRVVLVDDHPIVLEGLRGLLGQHRAFTVCGEAGTIAAALEVVARTSPDAAIVDVSLGRESGLDLIRRLREDHPRLAILALSMLDEMAYAERALRSGANGYVMKHEASQQLIEALRRVLAGKVFLSPNVTERVLSGLGRVPAAGDGSFGMDRLTDRELEIFRLIGQGRGASEIAAQLQISPKTVETHRARIKEKLGITSAPELVIQAASWVRGT
jgi:DNA-binding NarL/FixJ family response regulator